MGDNGDDPLVQVKMPDGSVRVMRMSQFKAMQQQEIQTFETQMTLLIEDFGNLSDALRGTAGEVWSAKWQLDSDMAGIENAMGTDDNGNKMREAWKKNYPSLFNGFESLAGNVDSLSQSLSQAADKLFQTESDTLKGFGITSTDPRPKPPASRYNPHWC
jgi:hypothetical protein